MRTIVFISLFLSGTFFSFINSDKPVEFVKYQVEVKNGMFKGNYTSWYKNGFIKAKGKLKNNNRIGEWIVFDTTGREVAKRNYMNLFQYKGAKIRCDLKKNEKGFVDYPKLLEKDVVLEKRVWRMLKPSKVNAHLFLNKRLMRCIRNNVFEEKWLAFDSDEFRKTIPLTKLVDLIPDTAYIVGFKLKEDWYYDSNYKLSFTQVIGICPLIKNKSGAWEDLFWIYYPSMRELLAKEKVVVKEDKAICSLEDLFHFRYFSSTIYKEANPFDRKIADYKKGDELKKEAEQIEMSILDLEHDIWLKEAR